MAFKASLRADARGSLDSWRPGGNPCGALPWAGVACVGGWVVGLQLPGAGLQGPLAPGLFNISHLAALQLPGNQLTGEGCGVGRKRCAATRLV